MSTHTPGPWKVEKSRGRFVIRATAVDEIVCSVQRWSTDVDVADANLLAAAPLLLEACKAIFASSQHGAEYTDDERAALALIEQAIQSATGA